MLCKINKNNGMLPESTCARIQVSLCFAAITYLKSYLFLTVNRLKPRCCVSVRRMHFRPEPTRSCCYMTHRYQIHFLLTLEIYCHGVGSIVRLKIISNCKFLFSKYLKKGDLDYLYEERGRVEVWWWILIFFSFILKYSINNSEYRLWSN